MTRLLGEDRRKDLRAIGHDGVDPEVEETMHLFRVVNRPDVHVDPARERTRRTGE